MSKEARKESSTTDRPPRRGEVMCHVTLLDNTEHSFPCQKKAKASVVIEQVLKDLDIVEQDYFSLFFFAGKQKIFLDPLKNVRDQIPGGKHTVSWRLEFGVKFYVNEPKQYLKEDYSRYLFCLQLCQDIKENRVLVDRETATRLSALMLQASLGDYDPEEHKPGYTSEFPDFILLPRAMQSENYEEQLVELHKHKAGLTPAQVELEFLEVAKTLPRYGNHLFEAEDSHQCKVIVGNSYNGVTIYREDAEVMAFVWPKIVKLSYKKRKLYVRYRPSDDGAVVIAKLFCGDPPNAKRTWKNAVEQHTFFRLSEPERPSVLQTVLLRGSKFRYSGRTLRQTQRDQNKKEVPPQTFKRSHSERTGRDRLREAAPSYVPSKDLKKPTPGLIGKTSPEVDNWVMLEHPSVLSFSSKSQYEKQLVEVNFRIKDGPPEEKFNYVIRMNKERSLQMDPSNGPENSKPEPAYSLYLIDEESTNATTVVTLEVNPKDGGGRGMVVMETTSGGKHERGVAPVFDSTALPVVMFNAFEKDPVIESVTSTSVVETPSGRKVISGGTNQQYMLQDSDISFELTKLEGMVNGGEEGVDGGRGGGGGGEGEGEQVKRFLEREHDAIQKGFEDNSLLADDGGSNSSPQPIQVTTTVY